MLLALDVGNTHTVVGLCAAGEVKASWRLRTVRERTADELAVYLETLTAPHGGLSAVRGAVLASVVPPLDPALERALEGKRVLKVDRHAPWSFEIDVERPDEVGADRLVNAEGALATDSPPLVLVDAGTATTVCAVGPGPRYLGGAITPGIETACEGLFRRAAKLAAVPLTPPPAAIGRDTAQALQSGIVLGFASMIDGLVARFVDELGGEATVLGTGGALRVLAPVLTRIDRIDPDLTLRGLLRLARAAGLEGA